MATLSVHESYITTRSADNHTHVSDPTLTARQLNAVNIVERLFSGISLGGCLFVLVTFYLFPSFRKPINRLILWATIGNVLATIATLISTDGITAGAESALCQSQAFLIQLLLPADSFWSLAMATNVYLTFFKGFDSNDLKRLEKLYAALCYGIPLLAAAVYLILDLTRNDRIYGPAGIWCWISPQWEWMRVAFFYGPVWVSIIITIGLYTVTAREIISRRRELREFSNPDPVDSMELGEQKSQLFNPFNPHSEPIKKVTEIRVTIEPNVERTPSMKSRASSEHADDKPICQPGFITSALPDGSLSPMSARDAPPPLSRKDTFGRRGADSHAVLEPQSPVAKCTTTIVGGTNQQNRVTISSPLTSPTFAPPKGSLELDLRPTVSRSQNPERKERRQAYKKNNAAWSYAKVSLLFFIALFIVWVPSTVNRIYSLAKPDSANFPLSIAAAAVLPMQGFWNALIYAVTSWPQCKAAWYESRDLTWKDVIGFSWLRAALPHKRDGHGRSGSDASNSLVRLPSNGPSSYHARQSRSLWKELSLQDALDMDPRNDSEDHLHRSPSQLRTIQESPSKEAQDDQQSQAPSTHKATSGFHVV